MGRKGKNSDLGRAIVRRKQRDKLASRTSHNTAAAQQAAATGRHTTSYDERGKLQSVLDATDLEELMLNATMANEDFTAQRYPGPLAPQTVVVTPLTTQGAIVPQVEKERRRELDRVALRIPRRPKWDSTTTPMELIAKEAEEFLVWRRNIATVEEENTLSSTIGGPMMTPFEKNLEVWRQLWRVCERSDAVIQIVDARNPLLYYCEDLYRYVTKELGRAHLLVLNKSDLLSPEMISKWEDFFAAQNLDVIFFSAFKASVKEVAHDSRVVGSRELIDKLHKYERKAPQTRENQRLVVGMCGYPNVGKSSTINVLLETMANADGVTEDGVEGEVSETAEDTEGEEVDSIRGSHVSQDAEDADHSKAVRDPKHLKRVAVSSTPGKTKHFQTLVLSEEVLLCDCPGLVFPNFSSSKAELICAGVLSIDQMRGDYLSPVSLVANRIPAAIFEGVYGLRFPITANGVLTDIDASLKARNGYVSGTMLLDTHARARGFMTDHNRPDQSRSARVLLKEYVNGRINFTHAPPPNDTEDGQSGIGPAVHAKKGMLVYQRREAAEIRLQELASVPVASKVGQGTGSNPLVLGVEDEQAVQGGVRARVSGKKKAPHREFTRVERNYYPAV